MENYRIFKTNKFNSKQKVMREHNNPLSPDGGIVGLKGNLAPEGAIVKIAGLKKLQFTGRARCFDTEESAYKAIKKRNVTPTAAKFLNSLFSS